MTTIAVEQPQRRGIRPPLGDVVGQLVLPAVRAGRAVNRRIAVRGIERHQLAVAGTSRTVTSAPGATCAAVDGVDLRHRGRVGYGLPATAWLPAFTRLAMLPRGRPCLDVGVRLADRDIFVIAGRPSAKTQLLSTSEPAGARSASAFSLTPPAARR